MFAVKCRSSAAVLASIVALVLLAAVLAARPSSAWPDEPAFDIVGPIEGEAIAVQGHMNVDVVHGQVKTILRSGSDVLVKSGQAEVDLIEGGHISICGPAHLSVLKSVGLLTLALDSGTIHAYLERAPALTVYTAQIQAKPIAIGDAPQDALVGFDAAGALCVRAISGAVRVEQQLTAQSIIVPQGADILVNNGQLDALRSGAGHCSCELQFAKAALPPPEVSRLPSTTEMQQAEIERSRAPSPVQKPPVATEEPVYQVFMPPLSYDSSAKVQRDNFDPQLIVLVRRVRVRPTLIFQGRVEEPLHAGPANPPPNTVPPPASAAKNAPQSPAKPQNNDTVINRVRAFFHRLVS